MSKLKPTEGVWEAVEHSWSDSSIVATGIKTIVTLSIYDEATEKTQEALGLEMDANCRIIADAGTTFNKCGKLASELLAERNTLENKAVNLFEEKQRLLAENEELKEALSQAITLLTSIQGQGFKEWVEYETWNNLLTKYNNQ